MRPAICLLRPTWLLALIAGIIGGQSAEAATLVVANKNDSGAGSLRQQIANANSGDVIVFSDGLTGTITLTSGELLLTNSLTINGPGANVLTLSGNNTHRVLHVSGYFTAAQTVIVSGLTIAYGKAADFGGGIYQEYGTYLTVAECAISNNTSPYGAGVSEDYGYVVLTNCIISSNTASGGMFPSGGGIYHASGTLIVVACTVSGNAAKYGGGVQLGAYDHFINSTIASNSASFSGGGFYGNPFLLAVTNCTIAGNSAPSGSGTGMYLYNGGAGSSATFQNNIIAGNAGSGSNPDCIGTVTSAGFNLIGNGSGSTGWGGPEDQVGSTGSPINPLLGPLQNNGGPTPTMGLMSGSPAIDRGNSGGIPTDQRGRTRPYDNPAIPNAPGGDGADIGAFEVSPVILVVNNANDNGPGSLRQALLDAGNSDSDTITFDASVTGTITLLSGELVIGKSLKIQGPGAKVLSVSGNNTSRVFNVTNGTVTISDLTIANGSVTAPALGGGIRNSATLTIQRCLVTANHAASIGMLQGAGGGFGSTGSGSTLRLLNSTVSGNSASQGAGGYDDVGSTMNIQNSTVSGNSSGNLGGGLSGGGVLTVANSTVTGNAATSGGGIFRAGGSPPFVSSSLIAGNNAGTGSDLAGSFTSGGFNLIGERDGSSGFANGVNSDQVGTIASPLDPLIGPLADNGGPTPTVALLAGSPAIDQGNSFGLTTDQRGQRRPYDFPSIPNAAGGDGTDIGAFEVQPCTGNCPAHVTVDASRTVRVADARWFGLNTAIWDSNFDTPPTAAALKELGCRTLRFPGGSLSDFYHWATGTRDDGYPYDPTKFSNFMHIATNAAAQVFITVNYGTGTSDEAANWVRAANITNLCGFKFWEVGNECYGSWEADNNTNAPQLAHDPWTYAMRFVDYYTQMKAADPTIKIGIVVTPGEDNYINNLTHSASNPCTGLTHYGWTPVLLSTLNTLGVTPDFVVHHFYPEYQVDNDAALLQAATNWAADAADLRQQITDYLGDPGTNIELLCTENNADSGSQGRQSTSVVNALYLADSLSQLMKTEFNSFIWWDLRNGADPGGDFNPSLYGWRTNGDLGIMVGPNTRYPTFYGMKLVQYFIRPGDIVLNATSDNPLLSTYAAHGTDDSLTMLVINKDRATTYNAQINLANFSPWPTMTVRSYGIPQDEATRTNGPASAQDIAVTNFPSASANFSYTFPPYSLTLFTLGASNSLPAAPQLMVMPAPTGQFVFQIQGQPYVPYVIQSSTDLTTWSSVETNASINGVLYVTNPVVPGPAQEFWRVVWMP